MALSRDEQAQLDLMEAALAEEDPKLASTLRGTTARRIHRRRAALAGLGFILGIVCLIVGMVLAQAVVSIVGFVFMLAATVVAISAWERADNAGESQPAQSDRPQSPRPAKQTGADMMGKLEDRWRRRQQGDL